MNGARKDDAGRDYIARVREDAQRCVHELLAENDKLRELAESLELEKQRLVQQLETIRDEVERFHRERADLQQRLAEIRGESRRFAQQFVEIERQNSNLANLYVASYQLHGTLDRARVVEVIQEILANLVGSEESALFELDETSGALRLIAAQGMQAETLAPLAARGGLIGKIVAGGETWIAGADDDEERAGPGASLTACVPLKIEERVMGAIAVFRLLPQKTGIEPVDRELFDLLATHAATALYCTGLRARVAA